MTARRRVSPIQRRWRRPRPLATVHAVHEAKLQLLDGFQENVEYVISVKVLVRSKIKGNRFQQLLPNSQKN